MSGDVTSIPSLTRSGRPSFSFSSSAPAGRTAAAFRVRSRSWSATAIGRSILGILELPAPSRAAGAQTVEGDFLRTKHEAGLCPHTCGEPTEDVGMHVYDGTAVVAY